MNYLQEKQLDVCRFLIENEIPFLNENFSWDGESVITEEYELPIRHSEVVIEEDMYIECDDVCLIIHSRDGSILIMDQDELEEEIEFEDNEEFESSELEILKLENKELSLENEELLRENSMLMYRVADLEEMFNNLVQLFNKRRVSR